MKNIEDLEPSIATTYRAVKARQDDLEHRRKEADEKLLKLKELIEQVLAELRHSNRHKLFPVLTSFLIDIGVFKWLRNFFDKLAC